MATSSSAPEQPNYNIPSEYHLTLSPLPSPMRESVQAAAEYFNTNRGETLYAVPPLIPHMLQTLPEHHLQHPPPRNFQEAMQTLINASDDQQWNQQLQAIINGNRQVPQSPQDTLFSYDEDEEMPDASPIISNTTQGWPTAPPQQNQDATQQQTRSQQSNASNDQNARPRYVTDEPFTVASNILMLAPNEALRLQCLHYRIMRNREDMHDLLLANELITSEIGAILRNVSVNPSHYQGHCDYMQEEWRQYAYRLIAGEHTIPAYIPLYPIHPMHIRPGHMHL